MCVILFVRLSYHPTDVFFQGVMEKYNLQHAFCSLSVVWLLHQSVTAEINSDYDMYLGRIIRCSRFQVVTLSGEVSESFLSGPGNFEVLSTFTSVPLFPNLISTARKAKGISRSSYPL